MVSGFFAAVVLIIVVRFFAPLRMTGWRVQNDRLEGSE